MEHGQGVLAGVRGAAKVLGCKGVHGLEAQHAHRVRVAVGRVEQWAAPRRPLPHVERRERGDALQGPEAESRRDRAR